MWGWGGVGVVHNMGFVSVVCIEIQCCTLCIRLKWITFLFGVFNMASNHQLYWQLEFYLLCVCWMSRIRFTHERYGYIANYQKSDTHFYVVRFSEIVFFCVFIFVFVRTFSFYNRIWARIWDMSLPMACVQFGVLKISFGLLRRVWTRPRSLTQSHSRWFTIHFLFKLLFKLLFTTII